MVICGGCQQKFDRHSESSEYIGNKWYHKRCAKIKHEKQDLNDYICAIFNLKKPGPANFRLISSYIQKGYTYVGIMRALKYFFEVKNNNKDKSGERIGIVPYVYEDAQRYFDLLERRQNEIGEKLNNALENKEKIISMEKIKERDDSKRNNQELFDLDSLLEE